MNKGGIMMNAKKMMVLVFAGAICASAHASVLSAPAKYAVKGLEKAGAAIYNACCGI